MSTIIRDGHDLLRFYLTRPCLLHPKQFDLLEPALTASTVFIQNIS